MEIVSNVDFAAVNDLWFFGLGWVGAAIGAAAAIGGGLLGGSMSKSEASKLRDWQADQYARRYQITMSDMRAAGLNPMLAYSQGPGTSPSGTMADMSAVGRGFAAGGEMAAQANVRTSSAKNLNQQTELAKEQEKKTRADAALAQEKLADYRAVGPNDTLATARRLGKGVESAYGDATVQTEKQREIKRFTPEWMMGEDLPKGLDPRLKQVIINERFRVQQREANRPRYDPKLKNWRKK